MSRVLRPSSSWTVVQLLIQLAPDAAGARGLQRALNDAHDLGVAGRPQDGIRCAQTKGLDGAPFLAFFGDHHQRRA